MLSAVDCIVLEGAVISSLRVKKCIVLFRTFKSGNMIYLLTAVVFSPGGSTHLHTNNTQNNTNNN
jgi:hypothetical protein